MWPAAPIVLAVLLTVAATSCGARIETKVTPSPGPATATPVPTRPPALTPTAVPTLRSTSSPTPRPSPTAARTATATAVPAAIRSSGPEARNLVRGEPSKPFVALTFDAGSDDAGTESILAVLREHGVHSTFFLTGEWTRRYPEMSRKIAADGHELGNHSFSHPDLTQLSDDKIASEVTSTEELIRKVTGADTKPLFRFPFGAYDARVLRVLHNLGYVSIYWTVDSTDWREESTARSISEQVLGHVGNGYIVVHHASPKKTAEALKVIIPVLKARGFSLVPVSKLF